jgi:hypothetical protein
MEFTLVSAEARYMEFTLVSAEARYIKRSGCRILTPWFDHQSKPLPFSGQIPRPLGGVDSALRNGTPPGIRSVAMGSVLVLISRPAR